MFQRECTYCDILQASLSKEGFSYRTSDLLVKHNSQGKLADYPRSL